MEHRDDLHSISHEESDANVKKRKNGKGITKGPVDDVPELKHPLRAREEEDALGQGGLLLRDTNGTLELLVARRALLSGRQGNSPQAGRSVAAGPRMEHGFHVPLEFPRCLDQQKPFFGRNELAENIQERCLTCSRPTCNQNVFPGQNVVFKLARQPSLKRAGSDEILASEVPVAAFVHSLCTAGAESNGSEWR